MSGQVRRLRVAPGNASHAAEQLGLTTSVQVCKVAGISYRQLDYWCRTGLLQSCTSDDGSGSARLFEDREVLIAIALGALSEYEISPSSEMARRVIDHVGDHGLSGVVFSTDGLVSIDVSGFA